MFVKIKIRRDEHCKAHFLTFAFKEIKFYHQIIEPIFGVINSDVPFCRPGTDIINIIRKSNMFLLDLQGDKEKILSTEQPFYLCASFELRGEKN